MVGLCGCFILFKKFALGVMFRSYDLFTLYGFMVVMGLCVGMLRLCLSWVVCHSWSAKLCFKSGVSKLCKSMIVASDSLSGL